MHQLAAIFAEPSTAKTKLLRVSAGRVLRQTRAIRKKFKFNRLMLNTLFIRAAKSK
jgi:hypothetical protein